jgi:transcriptional regulator with XRE-family HTH domain
MSKFKKDPTQGRNSHNNKDSRAGTILCYIREARKLSLKDAASLFKLKALEVDHLENGRRFYTEEEINMFLKGYEFSTKDFQSLMNFKFLSKQIVNHFILQTQNKTTSD